MNKHTHFIAGNWLAGDGHDIQSIDPAKKDIIWQAKSATQQQVDSAVNAARSAFVEWSNLSFDERLGYVKKFAELLGENKQALALNIAQETGKPLWETATEVGAMIGKIGLSEKAYHERTGTVENAMPLGKAFIRHKPHGVVAVFGPYNFPGHLPNGHIVPALLAGNTIVFKPSDLTPVVAEKTIELWQQAGLPAGVLNMVQGEVETGKALASHNGLDGLFFTGSSRTGKLLHEQFAGHPGKILALEMGGNNPLIVKDAADTNAVVHDIIQSAFVTSGQRCTCARRLFIQQGEAGDAVLKKLLEATNNIQVGMYDAESQPFMGAMVSQQAASLMVAAQQQLLTLGAKPLVELKHLDPDSGFVSPGILAVFMLGLFWKKTTNKAAIIGALASIPIAMYFKVAPNGWSASSFFVDVPFMDQMGYTVLLTMVVIIIASLMQHKGKDDEKGIDITRGMFKTSPVFNIGAFAVMLILVVLYSIFWN